MFSAFFALALALAGPASSTTATSAPAPVAAPLATPQFRRYGLADGLPGAMVYGVVQDHQGYMWFATTGGLGRFDGVRFKVFRHDVNDPQSLPNNQIYTLFVDHAGRLWAGGVSSGLSRYDAATGGFIQWRHDDGDPASLSHNEVWSIAQTPDGSLWVATQNGLDRMHADGKGFDHISADAGASRRVGFGPVRALLAEPDGRLWIGAEHGIYLRLADGQVQPIKLDPSIRGGLSKIWHIEGGGDEVRVSTSTGLLRIGPDLVARPVSSALAGIRTMSSARDARGRLWVGTESGVWMESGGRFQAFHGNALLPGGFPADWVWQITRDREGGLWFAVADGGVAYLAPDWDGFTRITHIPDDPASLTTTGVEVVQASRDNQLWVGEVDSLDKLDPATGHVQHVLRNMPEGPISMAEDEHGRLWIAGQGALYVLDKGQLATVDTSAVTMTRPTRLVLAGDGRIYVASWGEGIFAIDPDSRKIFPVPMSQPSADAMTVSVFTTHHGVPWYASGDGLMRLDAASGQMVFVDGVPRRDAAALAFDSTGFWVAWASGLEHYRYADGKAVRDREVVVPADWQQRDLVGGRVDQQGALWLFASQGLWRFDPQTNRFTAFGPQNGLLNGEFNNDHTAMLADGSIYGATKNGVIGFNPRRLVHDAIAQVVPKVEIAAVAVRRKGQLRQLPLNGATVNLGWADRDLHIEARVSSFINPPDNHFRFRLKGFDAGWVDVDAHGEREFAGLGPGEYTLEVMGAGPGGDWGRLAAPLTLHVQSPPWDRWWAWLSYAGLAVMLIAGLTLAWRQRMAQQHHMQLSEQKRRLAEQASAAKTRFLATLSHEIRTPMTGVIGMAELLLATPLRRDQNDYALAMQRSGEMLLKLLNDALDLASIEAGRLQLELAPFDPRQLLDDVAQLAASQAQGRGIGFNLEVSPQLPVQLVGDAVRIKQILLNLTTNAVKFTEHGEVTLRAHWSVDGVQLSVTDTGPGIPEASQARLFRRFEQADGPQRRAGSGLGLAICSELAAMMGGSIELTSRLAYGSTFLVHLPLKAPPRPTEASPPPPRLNNGRRHRLLLVEDDAIVAAVICGLLEKQGHTVIHVANGLGALAELSNARFDAMLLDLDLPGVDGFQLARLIRQREGAGEHLPIIAITARSDGDDEARTREAGMDSFLRKPLTGEQLARVLEAKIAGASTPA